MFKIHLRHLFSRPKQRCDLGYFYRTKKKQPDTQRICYINWSLSRTHQDHPFQISQLGRFSIIEEFGSTPATLSIDVLIEYRDICVFETYNWALFAKRFHIIGYGHARRITKLAKTHAVVIFERFCNHLPLPVFIIHMSNVNCFWFYVCTVKFEMNLLIWMGNRRFYSNAPQLTLRL